MASQVENPLNDLFGKKGNSGGMASLLGSFSDVSRSKSTTSYQGRKLLNCADSSDGDDGGVMKMMVVVMVGRKIKIPVVPVSYREKIRVGRSEIIFF